MVESAEYIEFIEPDMSKSASTSNLLRKQENTVMPQIPFERRDVPHALYPGAPDLPQIEQGKDTLHKQIKQAEKEMKRLEK